jgi:plasmid stabilization system protein ParE
MTLPIVLRSEASADAQSIHESLSAVSSKLGARFVEHLNDRLAIVASQPRVFAKVWRNVRATKVKRFTYVVYYRILKDRFEVLAIVHGNRNDSSWKSRV